ncbi:hypothetical protein ABIA16_001366 [Sinorhizobium fredii]
MTCAFGPGRRLTGDFREIEHAVAVLNEQPAGVHRASTREIAGKGFRLPPAAIALGR